MHSIPPWYIALYEFSYIFHSVMDLAFIVFGFAIVAVVSRPGWKHHLRWANPAAAASVLQGTARLALDAHHYFRVGTALNADMAFDLCNYGSNILSLYSIFILWRTLRDLANRPSLPGSLAEHPEQPGVWPPAPTLKR